MARVKLSQVQAAGTMEVRISWNLWLGTVAAATGEAVEKFKWN